MFAQNFRNPINSFYVAEQKEWIGTAGNMQFM